MTLLCWSFVYADIAGGLCWLLYLGGACNASIAHCTLNLAQCTLHTVVHIVDCTLHKLNIAGGLCWPVLFYLHLWGACKHCTLPTVVHILDCTLRKLVQTEHCRWPLLLSPPLRCVQPWIIGWLVVRHCNRVKIYYFYHIFSWPKYIQLEVKNKVNNFSKWFYFNLAHLVYKNNNKLLI